MKNLIEISLLIVMFLLGIWAGGTIDPGHHRFYYAIQAQHGFSYSVFQTQKECDQVVERIMKDEMAYRKDHPDSADEADCLPNGS